MRPYIKITLSASVLLPVLCLALAACDTLGLRDMTSYDQVPSDIKTQPRLVETAPLGADPSWPRVGDVPFKPKDFSPPPVYNHYMNELEYERYEAETAKKKAVTEDPLPEGLVPPQLPH